MSAAGGAGVALVIAACGGGKSLRSQLAATPGAAETDIALLNHLLDLEHVAIAAYTAGIPLMGQPAARTAKRFLDQEIDHAAGLAALVKAAGGKGNAPRPSYNLGHPGNTDEVLRLLHAAESAQLAAYVSAIPRLQPGALRAAAGGYLANDAQHLSILRALLGQGPLPAAFVTGRE